MNWHNATKLDSNLPITQIYLWLISNDKKVVIVSKDNMKWQFPGGHPKEGETYSETLERELMEETGLVLNEFGNPILFGYYEIEKQNDTEPDKYLQLRYYLQSSKTSSEIELRPIENKNDPDPIIAAKWADLDKLAEFIPWTKDLEEYNFILKLQK